MIELTNSIRALGTWMATPDNIGIIVLSIIVAPILIVVTIALFSSIKTSRIPSLFMGSVVGLIGFVLISFALFGALLKFVVPQ
jgi:hypothetical protein